jgi:glycolate oxidase iron-sulfur subunit
MKKSPEDCLHCGKCIVSCPSYRLFLNENFSPRGRNLLFSRNFDSIALDFCLFCENCKEVCPQGLSFPEFYLRKVLKEKGYPWPYLSDSLTLLYFHPEGKKLYKKFSPESIKFFKKGDFYIYLSCGLKHLYPQALFNFLEKIKAFGFKAHIPMDQDCCGIIYVTLKARETLKKFAIKKLGYFEEKKPVVTFCATCYWMLKRVYPLLFEGEKEEEEFISLSERTYFVSDFMIEYLNIEPSFKKNKAILYHLPCHLKNDLTFQKRTLKKLLENVSETCCGSAKLTLWVRGFQKDYSKFWKRDLFGKSFIATACTGCYLNFSLQIRRPPEIKHWIELIE